jgi:integrase
MILLAFRHGLRASELCSLRWDRSILPMAGCTSPGSKSAYPRFTRSPAANCAFEPSSARDFRSLRSHPQLFPTCWQLSSGLELTECCKRERKRKRDKSLEVFCFFLFVFAEMGPSYSPHSRRLGRGG